MIEQPRPTPRGDADAYWSDTLARYVHSEKFVTELENESDAREERIREMESLLAATSSVSMKAIGYLQAENAKLREALVEIGEYKGEGGPATPWQDIVRNLGEIAREALAGEETVANEPLDHTQRIAELETLLDDWLEAMPAKRAPTIHARTLDALKGVH